MPTQPATTPFMYFHSIIDSKACRTHVVNLTHLQADLEQLRTTPNLVFITPNLCNDGHDGAGTGAAGTTCANGQPGGLTSADGFLQTWVPRILASPAYRADGLLIVTFDESTYGAVTSSRDPTTGQRRVAITYAGATCCHQQPGPNLAGVRPSTMTLVSTPAQVQNLVFADFGGDRIGARPVVAVHHSRQHVRDTLQPLFPAAQPRGSFPGRRLPGVRGRRPAHRLSPGHPRQR